MSARVTTVLPEPEAGAAMIRASCHRRPTGSRREFLPGAGGAASRMSPAVGAAKTTGIPALRWNDGRECGDFIRSGFRGRGRRTSRGWRASARPCRRRRWPGSRACCGPGRFDLAEAGFEDDLVGQCGVGDDRQGVGRIAAAGEQQPGDLGQMLDGHVHDDDRRGGGDGAPVDIGRQRAGGIVAGEEDHRVVEVAMGGGDAGVGEPADAGRDAGHDAERPRRRFSAPGPPRRRGRR
jgi:hypothetical protein